jgi:hypothetical protein
MGAYPYIGGYPGGEPFVACLGLVFIPRPSVVSCGEMGTYFLTQMPADRYGLKQENTPIYGGIAIANISYKSLAVFHKKYILSTVFCELSTGF